MEDILMSLAVCNMVNRQQQFENKLLLSNEISEMIKPIVDERKNRDREDKEKELPKTVTNEIQEKRDKLNKLKKEKENSILTMLGQMYNGVIIPERLTVRRGEFYRYRCQWALSLNEVKNVLLKNLHEVTEKITNSKNLDILEYCLQIWDNDNDKVINFNGYYSSNKDKREKKEFRFNEIKIVECSGNRKDGHFSFDIIYINGVSLYDDGEIEFFHKVGKDESQKQIFQSENFNDLYLKYEDNIKIIAEDFIKELDNKIKVRSDELDEIKLKGSHLLMSAELQKGTDDLKGFGGS